MRKITILGAGAWAGALAHIISHDKANKIVLWTTNKQESMSINNNRQILNLSLSSVKHILGDNIYSTTDLKEALKESEFIIFALPSIAVRNISMKLLRYFPKLNSKYHIISATKGIEFVTNKLMTQVIEEVIPKEYILSISCISGPSHAEEVICNKLTAVVLANIDSSIIMYIAKLFYTKEFNVFLNKDIVGVQVGGALKNILAILSGILHEQDLGDNAFAALMSRALNEIVIVGKFLGGNVDTFLGLSGIGDLLVTYDSRNSRNFQAGKLLAQGNKINTIEKKLIGQVIEGVNCLKSINYLSQKNCLPLPILYFMNDLIFEDSSLCNIKEIIKNDLLKSGCYE